MQREIVLLFVEHILHTLAAAGKKVNVQHGGATAAAQTA
jgi:hypothetical protein